MTEPSPEDRRARGLALFEEVYVAIHLITYAGTPASGDILRVSEAAIARHTDSPGTRP